LPIFKQTRAIFVILEGLVYFAIPALSASGFFMATNIKITQSFSVTAGTGDLYVVQEHTRFTTINVDGVKKQQLGRAFLKTEDGRGVLKNPDNTYAIPSLGIKAAQRKD
jgi:hypothetical protein